MNDESRNHTGGIGTIHQYFVAKLINPNTEIGSRRIDDHPFGSGAIYGRHNQLVELERVDHCIVGCRAESAWCV